MDSAKFQEAQQAYDAGDFRTAAKGFLASAGRGTVGNGSAYHMAGNALMRLRRFSDAVTVYGHALRDEMYDKRGSVFANLGAAHVALGAMSEAIDAYEAALEEPGYSTPYKAYQGIAAVHMERGRAEEAAIAYRRAALDEKNPDPGKALVNLGLCFMALGRPSDAADAYKAALGFDNYAGRGRALANLGQSYTAMGEYSEAVKAFEKATQLHGHTLSPAARDAYETALEAAREERETIEGWVTGDMQPLPPATEPESVGWETGQLAALTQAEPVAEAVPAEENALFDSGAQAAEALGFGDEAAVHDFFTRSEDDMKQQAREARRAERASGGDSVMKRRVVVAVVALILIVGLVVAAYLLGLGWPTQTATVNGLMVAYEKGEPVDEYWVAVPDNDVKREMAKIPPVKDFEITAIERGRAVSTATVRVVPQEGAELQYLLTLTREGVGWRVTGLDYNWRSTGS